MAAPGRSIAGATRSRVGSTNVKEGKAINKVLLTGTVKDAPRFHTTETGKKKVELRVFDGKLHHTVIGWEEVADNAPGEGDLIFVDGRLGYRSYDKDGTKVWVTEVTAASIEKMSGATATTTALTPADDSDLGF